MCLCLVLVAIFLIVLLFSPSLVTKSTSFPSGVHRESDWYQKPIFEDYYCQEEEQGDSEVKDEDDKLLGAENQWCPLLDLSYHYFVGPRLLGFMNKVDAAGISRTCQFGIFIAPVERETATEHVWRKHHKLES